MGDDTDHSDFVQKLIDAVRERTVLYDKKHIAYFNRREREKAWRLIGQQLGRSDTDCHKRWKLLREKLAKELKKRDRALDNGEQFNSDWACFRNIMFVEDHIAPRRKSDRVASDLPTNLSKKRIGTAGDFEAYDLTKKRAFCPSDMNFLVQLPRASDLGSIYESDTSSQVKAEPEDRPIDELNTISYMEEEPSSGNSLASSLSARPQTPKMLDLSKAVDALLQGLRDEKVTEMSFLKNLTSVLNLKHPDAYAAEQNEYPRQEDNCSSAVANNIFDRNPELKTDLFHILKNGTGKNVFSNKVPTQSPYNTCGANNFSKVYLSPTEETKHESMKSRNIVDLQKESEKCQAPLDHSHFIGDKDFLFGQLVTSMLVDITNEHYKDDAKCNIMQLLVNAKRACAVDKCKSPESTSRD